MGRGQGNTADELFYGSEISSPHLSRKGAEDTKEDAPLWSLFKLLRDTPRDPLTLRPSISGDHLLSYDRSYSLFESKTLGPSQFMTMELVLGPGEEGRIETKVYGTDTSIPRHMRSFAIYSGQSLEEAHKAGRDHSAKWAKELGFFPAERYFDVTLAHIRDSVDLMLERASRS